MAITVTTQKIPVEVVLPQPANITVSVNKSLAITAIQQGPAGASGNGAPHQVQMRLMSGFSNIFPLAGPPIGGAVLVYLNGLVESHWHLSGTDLVIDADLLEGDEITYFYMS